MIFRRLTSICILSLGTTSLVHGQETLALTDLHQNEFLGIEATQTFPLSEFFQVYSGDGPILTMEFSLPVRDEVRELSVDASWDGSAFVPEQSDNPTTGEYITYETASGETYENLYGVKGEDFRWESHQLQFQLIPATAPISVANIMSYAKEGAYDRTVIHRNATKSEIIAPDAAQLPAVFPIIQMGGYKIYDGEGSALLEVISGDEPIVLEDSPEHRKGSMAMARGGASDSATNQFFINTADNSDLWQNNYAVFGQLMDDDEGSSMAILDELADMEVYWLTHRLFNPLPPPSDSRHNLFGAVPLFTPHWYDQSSWASIDRITVSEGNPDGVTYSWEYKEDDDEEAEGEEDSISPESHRDSFDIRIVDGSLRIDRLNKGNITIIVSGTHGDQTRSFEMRLLGLEENFLRSFPDVSLDPAEPTVSGWYGEFAQTGYPNIVHAEHGAQALNDVSYRSEAKYIYDYDFGYFYTTPSFYPRMYIFKADRWVMYLEGSKGDWYYDFEREDLISLDEIISLSEPEG